MHEGAPYTLLYIYLSEIESEADLQAHLTSIGEIVQAHVVVNSRLYGEKTVDVESITDLWSQMQIIDALRSMCILQPQPQVYAVLREVITSAGSKLEIIRIARMVVTQTPVNHPRITYKVSAGELQAHRKLLAGTVGHSESGCRSGDILCFLIKLCIRTHCHYQQQQRKH